MIRRFQARREHALLATGSLHAFYKHVNSKLNASQRVAPIYNDNNVLLTDDCDKANALIAISLLCFLMLLEVIDLPSVNICARYIMYADDTTLSSFGKSISFMITNIESDILLITEWLKHNRLIINFKKSKAMYFNSNQKNKKTIKSEQKLLSIDCNKNILKFSPVSLIRAFISLLKNSKQLYLNSLSNQTLITVQLLFSISPTNAIKIDL